MDPPPPKMRPEPKKPIAPWRPKFAGVAAWFVAAFFVGLLLQVFLAGYGLSEVGGQGMAAHVNFAHVIEIFPLLIVVFAFLGADKVAGIGGIVLLAQFQLQYVLIAQSSAILRALHPTNGVLMVLLSGWLLLRRPVWSKRAVPA